MTSQRIQLFSTRIRWLAAMALGAFMATQAPAASYIIDPPEAEVVGELHYEYARRSDTLMDIARWLNMGYGEIRRANPETNIWIPGEGARILIPSLFVLPEGPRDGIVINRAEMRLYYFHTDSDTGQRQVATHPVGIGRIGRETPTGSTRVSRKLDDPAWYPTDGVVADYASRGIDLPRKIPPGPDNPLGRHAMVLEMPGYLIHGTNRPDGVGMRVSQGCVRLYPEHIERLVQQVPVGTPVHFVDQPAKAGMRDGKLYLEVHRIGDEPIPAASTVSEVVNAALRRYEGNLPVPVDWAMVEMIRQQADGIPRVIAGQSVGSNASLK